MNYNILTYLIYLLITLYVVIYVGNVLFTNGRPFLVNTFKGDASVADSVNKVLLSGYYLINAGYTIMVLKVWSNVNSLQAMLEILSTKIGMIILTLGVMHLMNVILLITFGKQKKDQTILTNKNQLS